MGTDSVKLFNKTLADHILTMDRPELTQFLETNIDLLKQKAFPLSIALVDLEAAGDSVAQAVEQLLSEQSFTSFQSSVVQDFAFGDDEIYLDYWGCYAAVFGESPKGSISNLDLFPAEEEETFVLLLPDHVNQMIKSLSEHADDLTVMDDEQIEKLESWKNFCATNPGIMFAYLFDF